MGGHDKREMDSFDGMHAATTTTTYDDVER
jgi:hypothetical protein